jgi:hypothetical protein
MSEAKFCPVCHHKNDAEATICSFCSSPLMNGATALGDTTENITDLEPGSTRIFMPSVDYLAGVPDDALALFMMDEQEPIIIESSTDVVLGRLVEGIGDEAIDLTEYGGVELGVSRRHAKITCVDGVYLLEDLGSTNGTWLNQRRLTPGVPHRLHNHDVIMVGRLRMTVFLRGSKFKTSAAFGLTDTSRTGEETKPGLTPRVMGEVVNPYLQALIDVQEISDEARELESNDVNILAINSSILAPHFRINLDNAGEAIRLVQKWVLPWKRQRVNKIAGAKDENIPRGELINLADLMLTDIAPDLSAEERVPFIEELLTPLVILTSSPLEIDAEEGR